MRAEDLLKALALPEATYVNQRVPKKLLAEHGAATASDKRQIQEGIDEITWLAALKPHLIGVPEYRDPQRHYIELAVLGLTLKPGTKLERLAELLHRAVPYPVLLLTTVDGGLSLSLAHLRAAQNEADKTVLDGPRVTASVSAPHSDFLAAMALARQPQADLHALYQGWLDTVDALDIAREIGRYQPSRTREQAVARHAALQQCRQLQAHMAQLRAQAVKERQIARQVALNQEIRACQNELAKLRHVLEGVAP